MKHMLMTVLIVSGAGAAFLLGYNISSATGVEPGFFEAPEAAGYGAGVESKAPEGITQEFQDYYKSLTSDEQ